MVRGTYSASTPFSKHHCFIKHGGLWTSDSRNFDKLEFLPSFVLPSKGLIFPHLLFHHSVLFITTTNAYWIIFTDSLRFLYLINQVSNSFHIHQHIRVRRVQEGHQVSRNIIFWWWRQLRRSTDDEPRMEHPHSPRKSMCSTHVKVVGDTRDTKGTSSERKRLCCSIYHKASLNF